MTDDIKETPAPTQEAKLHIELFLSIARELEALPAADRGRILRALICLFPDDVAADGAAFDAWCNRHNIVSRQARR